MAPVHRRLLLVVNVLQQEGLRPVPLAAVGQQLRVAAVVLLGPEEDDGRDVGRGRGRGRRRRGRAGRGRKLGRVGRGIRRVGRERRTRNGGRRARREGGVRRAGREGRRRRGGRQNGRPSGRIWGLWRSGRRGSWAWRRRTQAEVAYVRPGPVVDRHRLSEHLLGHRVGEAVDARKIPGVLVNVVLRFVPKFEHRLASSRRDGTD